MLSHFCEFMAYASYQAKLYQVADYPGAVPSDNPADQVAGEVYRINALDWVLEQLDNYEECAVNFPPPTEYVRKIQTVRLQNGAACQAWVYVYNRPVTGLPVIVSGDYLNFLQAG